MWISATKNTSIFACFFFSNSHKLSPVQALCVFLIFEQQRGSLSPWKHYIDVLPSSYNNTLHWTDPQLCLLPKDVQTEANHQIQTVRDSYSFLQKYFISNMEKEWPALKGVLTWDKFAWAWSSVNTRCVFMRHKQTSHLSNEEDNYALAPFLDLLNHSATVQVGYWTPIDHSTTVQVCYHTFFNY